MRMKRKLILFIFTFYTALACGQKPHPTYCEIVVWSHHILLNAAVTFDFGMQLHTTAMLYDSKNQPLKFITGMDAVNYLSKRG